MADYAIHEETLQDIAGIIRKKDGTQAGIDPATYADRINLMGMLEEKTASGAIATFNDGADDVPLKIAAFNIEASGGKGTPTAPVSISGYNELNITHTGKNMLNPATCQRGYIEGGGGIHVPQAYQELYSDYIKVKPNITYTFSGTVNNSSDKWCGIAYYDKDKNFIIRQAVTTGTDEHFSIGYVTPSNTVYVRCTWRNYSDISSGGSVCPCQFEEGTKTDYEAYDGEPYNIEIPNPNPDIFDFTGGNYQRGAWKADGTVNPDEWSCRAYKIPIESGAKYDIFGEGFFTLVTYFDANDNFISSETLTKTADFHEAVTIPANCAYLGVSYEGFYVMETKYIKKAFNVYVGQYDAISGTLTITHVYRVYNTANMNNNNEIYAGWRSANIRDVVGTGLNQRFSNQNLNVGTDFSANTMGATNDLLMLPQSLYGYTQTEWQEMALDIEILLPLAEPIIINLDPVPINSKAGANNFWADTGDSEITYRSNGAAEYYPAGEEVSF